MLLFLDVSKNVKWYLIGFIRLSHPAVVLVEAIELSGNNSFAQID
jgi:hypothetical protein